MSVLSIESNASSNLSMLQDRVNQLHNRVLNLTTSKTESNNHEVENQTKISSLLEKYAERKKSASTKRSNSDSVTSEILPLKKRKKRQRMKIKKKLLCKKRVQAKKSSHSSSSSSSSGRKSLKKKSKARKPFLTKSKKNSCPPKKKRTSKTTVRSKIRLRSTSSQGESKKKKKKKEVKKVRSVTNSLSRNGTCEVVGLTEDYLRRIDMWDGWKAYKQRKDTIIHDHHSSKSTKEDSTKGHSQTISPSTTKTTTTLKSKEGENIDFFSELTSLHDESLENNKIVINKLSEYESEKPSSSTMDTSKEKSNLMTSISTSTTTTNLEESKKNQKNLTRNVEIQTIVNNESNSSTLCCSNQDLFISSNDDDNNTKTSGIITTHHRNDEMIPIKIKICNVMKDENDREFQKVEVSVTKKDGISQTLDLIIPTRSDVENNNNSNVNYSTKKNDQKNSNIFRQRRQRKRKERRRRRSRDDDDDNERRKEDEDDILMNSYIFRTLTGEKILENEENEEDVVVGDESKFNDITHNSSMNESSNTATHETSFEQDGNINSLKKLMMKYSDMK